MPAAGGILVTVNTRLVERRDRVHPRALGRRHLLLDAELAELVEPLDLAGIDVIRVDDTGAPGDPYEELLAGGSPEQPESWLEDEEETISINYTSGTTGRPKGVQYTYRGAYLNALSEAIVDRAVARVRLPLAAADVPLQRLVLPLGRDRGRRPARDDPQGRARPGLGPDRRRGRDPLQRRPDRAADGHQPPEGAPRRAAGDGGGRRRAALADAARAHGRAELPRRSTSTA